MNSKINSMVQTIQYCSLFIHNISNFVLTSSLRVDVLQFDNDVNKKSFIINSLITHSFINYSCFLIKSIPHVYPTPKGWVSKIKEFNRKETLILTPPLWGGLGLGLLG